MFEIKKVPLEFLHKIKEYRDFHREGFVSLRDTVHPDVDLKDFDFYFDYVVRQTEKLEL